MPTGRHLVHSPSPYPFTDLRLLDRRWIASIAGLLYRFAGLIPDRTPKGFNGGLLGSEILVQWLIC
jgi:hypothetical protein